MISVPLFCFRDRTGGRVSGVLLSAALAILAPGALLAQTPPPKPLVFVREVRIDSILLAFGADSARIRAAVTNVIRDAGRLASNITEEVPALDVDVTVPRPLNGGMFDPRGYVRIEVGRNLVERGKASALLWEGMIDLLETPSWHEFTRNTLADVVRAVNRYLLSAIRGS
jgi:hypothetical protein